MSEGDKKEGYFVVRFRSGRFWNEHPDGYMDVHVVFSRPKRRRFDNPAISAYMEGAPPEEMGVKRLILGGEAIKDPETGTFVGVIYDQALVSRRKFWAVFRCGEHCRMTEAEGPFSGGPKSAARKATPKEM